MLSNLSHLTLIYLALSDHLIEEWKAEFLSDEKGTASTSKQDNKKLKQEIQQLQKELNRKDRALSAAIQSIWGSWTC